MRNGLVLCGQGVVHELSEAMGEILIDFQLLGCRLRKEKDNVKCSSGC